MQKEDSPIVAAAALETVEITEILLEYAPRRLAPRIKAAPRIRQIYWCDFEMDPILPEMGKTRPALIISPKNTLAGPCLVLPISTDPQEGVSAEWGHRLDRDLEPGQTSWVVCNHLYTVSTARLQPLYGKDIPRLGEEEFTRILAKLARWLPRLPDRDAASPAR